MSAILLADFQDRNNFYTITSGQSHYDNLHPNPIGVVFIWRKNEQSDRWKRLKPNDSCIPVLLSEQLNQPDRYISVSEFHGWRIVAQLKSLCACFADIDGDGTVTSDMCLKAVSDAGLPSPTFVIQSGRGIHLYWCIDPAPAKALGVWQNIQNTILNKLKEQGLPVDMVAKDCTRVLRLAGSINSKTNTHVHGFSVNSFKWTLHTLCNEVLGYRFGKEEEKLKKGLELDRNRDKLEQDKKQRALADDIERDAKVRDFRAARIRKGLKPQDAPRGVSKGSIYEWWQLVYQDLTTIGDQLGGIPYGHMDTYLFIYSVALSWFCSSDALRSEVLLVAKKLMPQLKASEVKKAIDPNIKRVEKFLAGEKVEWQGQQRDPRYWFKRQTIFERLEEIIPVDLYPQLRAILPASVIKERKAEADKSRDRSERFQDKNTKSGVRVGNQEKAAQARELRASGKTYQEIAQMVDSSYKSVYRWCNSSS